MKAGGQLVPTTAALSSAACTNWTATQWAAANNLASCVQSCSYVGESSSQLYGCGSLGTGRQCSAGYYPTAGQAWLSQAGSGTRSHSSSLVSGTNLMAAAFVAGLLTAVLPSYAEARPDGFMGADGRYVIKGPYAEVIALSAAAVLLAVTVYTLALAVRDKRARTTGESKKQKT